MKRRLLVAGAVVLVLGLISGGLWVLLAPDHRPTPALVKATPCDLATPEALKGVYLPEPGLVYADVKCVQDRYAFGKLRSTQVESNDMPVLFEFKNDVWQKVAALTDMVCGDVPRDVWQQLNFQCISEPVVCRAGERRVIDVGGWLDCKIVLDIADRYQAAIKDGQAQGQGLIWESGEWSCAWPYEDGFAHVQVPLKCVRTSDNQVVQIGDYQ